MMFNFWRKKKYTVFFVAKFFNEGGELLMYSNGEAIRERKPVTYADIQEIEGFALEDIKTTVDLPFAKCMIVFWTMLG